MKQGSTDDPFAEEPQDGGEDADDAGSDTADDSSEITDVDRSVPDSEDSAPATGSVDPASASAAGRSASTERDSTDATPDHAESAADPDSSGDTATERQTLPYIHARDGVKDGRTQRPVFLRDHVEAGIDDLVAEVEAELGEDVYKTDVTEAAMAVAQEHPDLVSAKLEEWGYGWS